MRNIVKNSIGLMLGVAICSSPAFADGVQDRLKNLKISGFVDASYSGDDQSKTRGFGLDQVELDIEYNKDNIGLRFDLNGSPSAGGAIQQDDLFEQGFIYVDLPNIGDDGLRFTFGKFNAPIGWELLDAPDMYQFSHAMVFNNGLPTNFTGASFASTFGIVDAIIYGGNRVDTNGVAPYGAESFGTRVGITPMEGLNIGLSYLQTTNPTTTNDRTIDVDFTYDGLEGLVIGAEYNHIKSGASITSGGYFGTIHYDLNEYVGATVRYGAFDFDTALAGTAKQATVALTAVLGDGLGALIEYRSLDNGMAVAIDGAAANSKLKAYAFEMTYAF